jgi:hypothetical protein
MNNSLLLFVSFSLLIILLITEGLGVTKLLLCFALNTSRASSFFKVEKISPLFEFSVSFLLLVLMEYYDLEKVE